MVNPFNTKFKEGDKVRVKSHTNSSPAVMIDFHGREELIVKVFHAAVKPYRLAGIAPLFEECELELIESAASVPFVPGSALIPIHKAEVIVTPKIDFMKILEG